MATAYTDQVQKVYIAYYGRAADPVGLAYWAAKVETDGLDGIMASFGASAEATTLYGSLTNTAKVNALYQQNFGRDADFAGLMYYAGQLTAGTMTAVTIAQNIFDGASGADATILTNKLVVAKAYTAAIDTAGEVVAYSGTVAAAAARALLTTVDAATVTASFDVATSVASIVSVSNATPAVAGSTIALTATTDAMTGTGGADVFNGVLAGMGATGTTAAPGDSIDGGAGVDQLTISIAGASTASYSVSAITTSNLEKLYVSNYDTGATAGWVHTINGSLMTGLTTVGVTSSAALGDTVFSNIKNIVDVEMQNGEGDLTLNYTAAAMAGTADVQNVGLSNMTAGELTIGGVESIVVNAHTTASTLDGITAAAATSLTVTGDQNLDLGTALAATLTTVDASAFTGNLTAIITATEQTITGGTGDDSFALGNNLSADTTLDGGAGTDTISVTDAADITALKAANISNVEVLNADTNDSTSFDPSFITGLTTLTSSAVSTVNDVTFVNVPAAITNINVTGTEGVIATLATDTSADAITLTLGTATAGAIVVGQTTLIDYETINLVSNGGANATGAMSATDLTTLNITGAQTVTLGTLTGNTAIATVDASGMTGTGAVVMNATNGSTTAGTYTGSANADTLIGGTKADIMSGGAGIDTMTGGAGVDTISGGAGADIIEGSGGADVITGGEGADIINFADDASFVGMTTAETIDGGTGADTMSFNENGTIAITAAEMANVSNIETIKFAGNNTASLTLNDAIVAANPGLLIHDSQAAAGLTLVASALTGTNAVDVLIEGGVANNLTGGAGDDTFTYSTKTSGAVLDDDDTIDGNGGSDTLAVNLVGIALSAVTLTNVSDIETITVTGSAALAASITLADANFVTTATATTIGTIDASAMTGTGAFTFVGTTEDDSALVITGTKNNDSLTGGQKDDTITGGDGADAINGGVGSDKLYGGAGIDTFTVSTVTHFTGLDVAETVSGGAGADILTFTQGATTTLAAADLANLSSIETIKFSGAAAGAITLNDAVMTANGVASLALINNHATGALTVTASSLTAANSVAVTGGVAASINDSVTGGAGTDSLHFETSTAGAAIDANDVFNGGAGIDTLSVHVKTIALTALTLTNVSNIEKITLTDDANLSAGKITLIDANFASVAGTIDFSGMDGSGATSVDASAEDDSTFTIKGATGADTIVGGQKADVITGNAGADIITGHKGVDTLTGGAGVDTFVYTNADQSTSSGADSITDFVSGVDKISVTVDFSTKTTGQTVDATINTGAAGTSAVQSGLSGSIGQATYDTTNSQLIVNVNNDNLVTTLDYVIGVNAGATALTTIAEGDINFTIAGGLGFDTIVAGSGADIISTNTGGGNVTGGAGADVITFTSGVDHYTFVDSNGSDTVAAFDIGQDFLNFDGMTGVSGNGVATAANASVVDPINGAIYVHADGTDGTGASTPQAIADFTDLDDVASFLEVSYSVAASEKFVFVVNDLQGGGNDIAYAYQVDTTATTITGSMITLIGTVASGTAVTTTEIT